MRIRPQPVVSHGSRGHTSPTEALLTAAVLAALTASVPAQLQFDELSKRGLPLDRDATRAVRLGDVDGDGDLDVVFANEGQQNRLYLNDGSGVYNIAPAARMPPDSDDTLAATLGDVDGDGDLDMVTGNGIASGGRGQQNRLYLNDGGGTFTDATALRLPTRRDLTRAVALSDVDSDGDPDLVVGNDQQNRLYINDGNGTFTDVTASRMPAGRGWAVALGDVDSDGDLDIVFADGNRRQNRLFLNDGRGSYTDATATRMPADSDNTHAVALDDIDGDGDLDIVFGNLGQNRLYVNDGGGTFTDATVVRMPTRGDATGAVVLSDVDNDGDPDLIIGNLDQNGLYINSGNGTFTDLTTSRLPADTDLTHDVAMGDVDGDGDLDIVSGNDPRFYSRSGQNRLYVNDGTGTYVDPATARIPAVSDRTLAVALGDVDADGDFDLVSGNLDVSRRVGQARLYLNDGRGMFTDATAARMRITQYATGQVVMGDVDGDADPDLILNGDRLLLNDGTGVFLDAPTGRIPAGGGFVAMGDVDGDDDPDLAVGIYYGQNRLYLNDGHGTFTDATAAQMPVDSDGTRAIALGDVDGDGDLDIVLGNSDYTWGQGNRLYLNDGTGTFVDATSRFMPAPGDKTYAVALGDVDGDSDLDVIFGNSSFLFSYSWSMQNRLYLNDGAGNFTDVTARRMPTHEDFTEAVALADVDGDGDVDIVLANGAIGDLPEQNRVYLNDGNGFYTDVSAARMPPVPDESTSVALGDVDRDGDVDIVFGNYQPLPNHDCLYLNLVRQLDAPNLLRAGRPYTLTAYARYGPQALVDVAVPFISTATASIPFPPFGTIGVDPAQMVALSPFVIPQPTGLGSVSFTVPNLLGLVGASVYAQALLVPYPFQARLTNVTADVVIR